MKHALYGRVSFLYGRVSFAWTVGDGTEHEKRAVLAHFSCSEVRELKNT